MPPKGDRRRAYGMRHPVGVCGRTPRLPQRKASVGSGLEELVEAYQKAESRLRATLLGDGQYSSGAVRGEERREAVSRQLRQLRATFDKVVELTSEQGEALDEALRAQARRATRRTKKK